MSHSATTSRTPESFGPLPPGVRRDAPHHAPLQQTIDSARQCLLAQQRDDGHWVGELEGDTILESEAILLMAYLGREREPRCARMARYLLNQQQPGGGWSNYPDGPVELSGTVKAYFALKLTGHDPDAPYMQRACAVIRSLGGAARVNSFTKFYLALLGQFPYDNCASVPPEMMFLPTWAYFNIYAMSSWTRTIVIPLSIFSARKPLRQLPDALGIRELFLSPPETPRWPHPPTRRLLSWTNFFLGVDQVVKWYERWCPSFLRAAAVKRARAWMIEHFADSDGLGAIFPPIIYTIISLRSLGYTDDTAEMSYALKQLDDLMIEENGSVRVQPCVSPVWDTALAVNALASAGVPTRDASLEQATRWLLDREVRRPGDWSLLNPKLEPAGWCFEYRNGFYPDTDDTAMVLMGLARSGAAWQTNPDLSVREPTTRIPIPAAQRGVQWLLGMQNSDGGWAAFDRDINREVLEKVPFADHNAMLDPSCPDITARVLEALGEYGYRVTNKAVERGIAFIRRTQDKRGCWLGRWGVNYLYGTWQVLAGLRAVGFDMREPMVRRAVAWLQQVQQASGGWGESCASYDDPALAGQGTVTVSQTAWALLGLIAAGEADSEAVRAGIDYLTATQGSDGNWQEEQFTGTGFPKVFYLKYHLYRLYFPLMALARFAQATGVTAAESIHRPHHQLVDRVVTHENSLRLPEAV